MAETFTQRLERRIDELLRCLTPHQMAECMVLQEFFDEGREE